MNDNVDLLVGLEPKVTCRWAQECQQAAQCGHGQPHEADSHCEDPCVCYDIQPPRRAWCVLHQPNAQGHVLTRSAAEGQ